MVIECYEIAPGGKYVSAKKAVEYGIGYDAITATAIKEFVDLAKLYFVGESKSYAIIMRDGSYRYQTDIDDKIEFVFLQECRQKNMTVYKFENFTGPSDQ